LILFIKYKSITDIFYQTGVAMYKNSIIVNITYGIHTRIAAMIVNKASELKAKYNINLYIRKLENKEPIAISMLALISLKIKQNEIIEVSCYEDSLQGRNAVLELCSFISTQIEPNNSSMSAILPLTPKQLIILSAMPSGISYSPIQSKKAILPDVKAVSTS
jgi:phosphotransferase system HPr (HPr) family protein